MVDAISSREDARKRGKELVKSGGHDVAHLDWRKLITVDGAADEDVAAIDSYFKPFAAPVKRGNALVCLCCGNELNGLMAVMFGHGGFEWGLVHGEGHCRFCRWPARAHHFIKDAAGKDLISARNIVLQYHPSALRLSKPETAEASHG